ncbi:hypothetical protein GGI15_002982 [Coemansia interrupta]|uniref:Glutaredoxin domain-containing protein n=1 Tax=Coemansia interrupta TaxID=1126814 RepID=A0A9W8LHR0_9FUNG|nr:hypothetical protein GGI15_002982 [Coemansia interrupta]
MDVVTEDRVEADADIASRVDAAEASKVNAAVDADAVAKVDDASGSRNLANAENEQESADKKQDESESPTKDDDTPDDEPASASEDKEQDEKAGDESDVAAVEEIEKPRVQIYGSTVSGNRTYKKQARDLFAMLEANEIDFEFICLAVDESAKKYVRRKALGNMTIPQVYVDGEFKGFYEDAFQANENDELYEWLGLDEEPFEY